MLAILFQSNAIYISSMYILRLWKYVLGVYVIGCEYIKQLSLERENKVKCGHYQIVAYTETVAVKTAKEF